MKENVNEQNVNEQNVNKERNTMNETTMKEQNETLSAEEVQDRIFKIGEAEENAMFLAKDFAAWLALQKVFTEQELKEWAVGQLLWEKDWPGPRTIWQAITKGTLENEGKKTRWKVRWEKDADNVPYRIFKIEWGSEFSLYQEFALSLVAGLGKVAGVLASRKKRAGYSTVPGTNSTTTSESSTTNSTTSSTTNSTTNSTGTEVKKLKKENSSLYKEIEELRKAQADAYDKAKGEFSSLLEESAKREKSANDTAKKVKEQAQGMDEAILKALTTLNEAKSSQDKKTLMAIIEAAKAALAEAPTLEIGTVEKKQK